MSEFSQKSNPDFNTAADPAPKHDLRRMIELAFMAIMEHDWHIAHPLVQITGDDGEGFKLFLSSAKVFHRNEEEGLFNLETAITEGVKELEANYPLRFDARERIVSTPDLEVLIGLLSELTCYEHEPAISVPDLLALQSQGGSFPELLLH